MAVDLQTELFKTLLEFDRRGLRGKMGYHDAADIKPAGAKGIHKTQQVEVVGDAEVASHLVALNVVGAYGNDDLRLIFKLHQHPYLAVRLKAGKHAGSVKVVKKLAAELKIELAAEFGYAFVDFFRLQFQIFLVVEAERSHFLFLPLYVYRSRAYAAKSIYLPSRGVF